MMLRIFRLVVWAAVWVMVLMGGVGGQRLASNPLLIFGHVLQGLDPAGPPKLLSDEDEEEDEDESEDYLDDEDTSPFSFFG